MSKFLSQEWFDDIKPKAFTKFCKGNDITSLTMVLVEVYEDCPDHAINDYIWTKYTLDKGELTAFEYGTDEDDCPEGTYVIYGTYESYVKVLKGDVALAKAAISGMFQIDGNMLKGMRMLGTYSKVMDLKNDNGNTTY